MSTAFEPGELIGGLIPGIPALPDPSPPIVMYVYTYEQLKAFKLFDVHWLVRANYDEVQRMLEDGILKRKDKEYKEYLEWVAKNL